MHPPAAGRVARLAACDCAAQQRFGLGTCDATRGRQHEIQHFRSRTALGEILNSYYGTMPTGEQESYSILEDPVRLYRRTLYQDVL